MSDTPYTPPKPPKTITKVQGDEFYNITSPFMIIFITWVAISIGLIYYIGIVHGTITQLAIGLLLVGLVIVWGKYFSNTAKTEKSLLILQFRYADSKGKHTINKFSTDESILQKIVPIVNIHHGGIIEFKGKKWGILMETHPVRISDENKERKEHEKKMEKVVNGIPANMHFKTIACSRLEPRKPILEYILEITKKSTGKKATDLHLMSLYNKVAEDNSKVISWKYYVFQSLGEQPSLEAAKIQYGAVIPGLLKNMRSARLDPVIIEDPYEVARAYRTMLSELVI